MAEAQVKVIYTMDSEQQEVLVPYFNQKMISKEEIKELLYQFCPFQVTPITYFANRNDGFEIELYDEEDMIYSSEPLNVISVLINDDREEKNIIRLQ
ncbi:hypothetical protein CVD28_02500 [Bacillus sp. M6-12]|uniref:hypothetical protein n=1 Tax=Bacillus sp. M6-12 TaxID=2054166 RepID=UPI000C761F75|nr:hypothetical protein [Bacillus sp. M6-12]PLS19303.1 hypothetical protein CVD28_02500 [Bacillus sp. M6-12]